MKLPLRYFLLLCLLLGAFAVPAGWHWYQQWKAKEISRLQNHLDWEWNNEPDQTIAAPDTSGGRDFVHSNPKHAEWKRRVDKLTARLERLTGESPQRPAQRLESVDEFFVDLPASQLNQRRQPVGSAPAGNQ